MKRLYVFTENALDDLIHHSLYYKTIQEILGERFLNAVTMCADEISALPLGYENRYKNTRERKVKNFPHKLIYTFEGGVIYIHAVFALRQNPVKKYKNL